MHAYVECLYVSLSDLDIKEKLHEDMEQPQFFTDYIGTGTSQG